MKTMAFLGASALAAGSILAAGSLTSVEAATFSFSNITGNNAIDAEIGENQFFVDVTSVEGNQVLFKFSNIGPEQSTISSIYFDDGNPAESLQSFLQFTGSTGVSFSPGGSPPNLPGGNEIGFQSSFTFTANQPRPRNGINPGEWAGFQFSLLDGITFDDVLGKINSGDLRIGLHAVNFETGGSEGFVNNGNGHTQVPEPATTAALGLFALVGLGMMKKKSEVSV